VVSVIFNAFPLSLTILILVLAVRWGFVALKGGCCCEGRLGVAQGELVPEELSYLEPVWDLLLEIFCGVQNSLRFDSKGLVIGECRLDLLYSL
jgi:hypothetical protein